MQNHQMAAEFFIKENKFEADRRCWQKRIMSYQDLDLLLSRKTKISLSMPKSSSEVITRPASTLDLTTGSVLI